MGWGCDVTMMSEPRFCWPMLHFWSGGSVNTPILTHQRWQQLPKSVSAAVLPAAGTFTPLQHGNAVRTTALHEPSWQRCQWQVPGTEQQEDRVLSASRKRLL